MGLRKPNLKKLFGALCLHSLMLIKYELVLRLLLKSGNPKCHFSVWDSLMSAPRIGLHVLKNDVKEQCFSEGMSKV